jgi:hypothetical protein
MSRRTAAWLAWSLCAVCVVLIALGLLLDFVTDEPVSPDVPAEILAGPALAVLSAVQSLAYLTVGALIASRLPTNPIGWIFCGVGLLFETRRLTTAYANYALLENPAFPGGEYVAWFSKWVGDVGLALVGVFLMLLFPEGRLLSRRWRIVVWAALCGSVLLALVSAFSPEPLRGTLYYVDNPFGVVGVIGGRFTTYELFAASRVLGMALLATSTLAALISLIVRLHRARGDERQQIKWFLLAAVPAAVCVSLVLIQNMVYNYTTEFLGNSVYLLPWPLLIGALYVAVSALLVVPVFAYIAILKYRLYDIDVIINRTLVYGSLTATLVALYIGGITVLQRVFVFLTGQRSTLAVVASTLLIAALFNPLRRRIQSFIDRRFYRKKYDTRKTLEAFSATLRDETDLEALRENLVGVVRETMQPGHVSLWLRPDTPRNGTRVG